MKNQFKTSSRRKILFSQFIVVVVFLGSWEISINLGWTDVYFFSSPSKIGQKVFEWMYTGIIWKHAGVTLIETLLSFILGTLLGVLVGYLLAINDFASRVLSPFIEILNAMPKVTMGPLLVLWFGIGLSSKVALGILIVFFIVFFNTFTGIRDVDRIIINNARILGGSSRDITVHVLLPSAMIWILSSLRASTGFALVGAVLGEYLGSSKGLGYLIEYSQNLFDSTGVFAGFLVLAVIVLVMQIFVSWLEKRLLHWKKEQQIFY